MDLSKIGEVKQLKSWGYNNPDEVVSDYLAKGWVLLTVKVVEAQFKSRDRREDKNGYIEKEAQVVYVLGKPRENKSRPTDFDESNQR